MTKAYDKALEAVSKMTQHTPENVEKVATEFVLELAEWLRLDDRPKMQRINITANFIKNANDYYDANMAMDAAFRRCGLNPLPSENLGDEIQQDAVDLWNAAWKRAIEQVKSQRKKS